jgi:hypothetical protein
VNDPFLSLCSVRENILMRDSLLNNNLTGFNLPECVNAGNYRKGKEEKEDEEEGEKDEPHKRFSG